MSPFLQLTSRDLSHMPKIEYIARRFNAGSLAIIKHANKIIDEYAAQGYDLTLRQLYYQFVARDLIKNKQSEYKRLGSVINDARLAGLIDWERIEDRTRGLESLSVWGDPAQIVSACSRQYKISFWNNQEYWPECFPPETPVITNDGVVPIGSIQEGDYVLTKTGFCQKVTKVIRQKYIGELVRIKAVGLPAVSMTPNHPIYSRPYNSDFASKGAERKFLSDGWCPASIAKPFDLLFVPRLKSRYDVSFVDIPNTQRGKNFGEISLNEQLLAVIGIFIAEGGVRVDGRTTQFTMNAKEEHQSRLIRDWASSLGAGHNEYFHQGARIVYVFSKGLADFFSKEFGTGAYHKKLPEWVLRLPDHKLLRILEYYFRGDGSLYDESRAAICASTRSLTLAHQVQLALTRLGFATCLDSVQDHGELRYRMTIGGQSGERLASSWHLMMPIRQRRYNHIRMEDDYALHPIRSVLYHPYVGDVINLEVENDHSYCVPFTVHNCWIEKEALAGVFERVCHELRVPYLSCRGYTSQSEMWRAARRLSNQETNGRIPYIFHFGDHDPSGVDMSRDIEDRLRMFMGATDLRFERLALTMDQVEEYSPPSNPTKMTDIRADKYVELYGEESWELDALNPTVLSDLLRNNVQLLIDKKRWQGSIDEEEEGKRLLTAVSDTWEEITDGL